MKTFALSTASSMEPERVVPSSRAIATLCGAQLARDRDLVRVLIGARHVHDAVTIAQHDVAHAGES